MFFNNYNELVIFIELTSQNNVFYSILICKIMSFAMFLCNILLTEHKWSPRSPKKVVSIELSSYIVMYIDSKDEVENDI